MESLLQVFSEEEVFELININPKIKNVRDDDIVTLIDFLKKYFSDLKRLKNIIMSNPSYLSRDVSDVEELFNVLNEKNINNISVIIDTYPLFLNYYSSDILDFFELKNEEGLSLEEIREIIESEPYVIDEIM